MRCKKLIYSVTSAYQNYTCPLLFVLLVASCLSSQLLIVAACHLRLLGPGLLQADLRVHRQCLVHLRPCEHCRSESDRALLIISPDLELPYLSTVPIHAVTSLHLPVLCCFYIICDAASDTSRLGPDREYDSNYRFVTTSVWLGYF